MENVNDFKWSIQTDLENSEADLLIQREAVFVSLLLMISS